MSSIRERRHDAISSIKAEMNRLREYKDELEMVRKEKIGLEQQVKALKQVSNISNDMLKIREAQVIYILNINEYVLNISLIPLKQVNDLKKRLQEMESHADECLADLRVEYQKQIDNIRNLRQLYEERAEAAAMGHEREINKERAKNSLLEAKLAEELNSKQGMNDFIAKLETEVQEKQAEYEQMKAKYMSTSADRMSLASQMSLVNNLFSTLLSGDEGPDFDRFARMLEENRELISDLTFNGDINETASVLMDIAGDTLERSQETSCTSNREKIASNLPKVWRILVELLSHYDDKTANESKPEDESESRAATVSRTFLKLKDLILEKNALVKDIGRLKTLNDHLESRLDHQQQRLSIVSAELCTAWNAVAKLNSQHRKLHTHEKILRYELQHKRTVLNELKKELEYCREKWDQARMKNSQSEEDWQSLREEFSRRKCNSTSVESGFEDDESRVAIIDSGACSDEEESWLKTLSLNTSESEAVDEPQTENKKNGIKKLEEQSRALLNQMVRTSRTSDSITERLEELQRQYGRSGRLNTSDNENTISTEDEIPGTSSLNSIVFQSNEENVSKTDKTVLPLDENVLKPNEIVPQPEEERLQQNAAMLRPEEEERLQRRAARLKRLEEQCLGLFRQVSVKRINLFLV